jgi:hypothetical protein
MVRCQLRFIISFVDLGYARNGQCREASTEALVCECIFAFQTRRVKPAFSRWRSSRGVAGRLDDFFGDQDKMTMQEKRKDA